MLRNKKLKKAFTLVEMLIVVIIIGILMWALLPKLKWAQERARDTARKANLTTISTALEMYFNDSGTYPTWNCVSDLWGKLVPTYVSELPSDPQKWRITYWTKDVWCSGWVYGYSPMSRKWSAQAGSVLVTNIEAQGSVWNFILPSNGTTVSWLFTWTNNKVKDNSVDWDEQIKALGTDVLNDAAQDIDNTTTHFSDASIAEKFTCSKTALVSDPNQLTLCNRLAGVDEWKAQINNAMVYVLFN